MTRRYYAHEVELLPAARLAPVAARTLPAHWPRGPASAEARRLVRELKVLRRARRWQWLLKRRASGRKGTREEVKQ